MMCGGTTGMTSNRLFLLKGMVSICSAVEWSADSWVTFGGCGPSFFRGYTGLRAREGCEFKSQGGYKPTLGLPQYALNAVASLPLEIEASIRFLWLLLISVKHSGVVFYIKPLMSPLGGKLKKRSAKTVFLPG